MYRIQGSDNKEYGPVPAEMVRQWVVERRMNQATLASLEGEGVWKPLGQFPEFADLFAATAGPAAPVVPGAVPAFSPAFPSSPVDPEAARNAAAARLKAPAIVLIILSSLALALLVFSGIRTLRTQDPMRPIIEAMSKSNPPPPPQQLELIEKIGTYIKPITIAQLAIGIPWTLLVLVGARRMMQVRSRGLAMTSAILGAIPCCWFYCLSIPFGIWALVVLLRPEVKSAFRD